MPNQAELVAAGFTVLNNLLQEEKQKNRKQTKVHKKREREVKGLDKSEKHVKKGKLHVGDRELGREKRKRRAQAQMMKEKAGGKWMGCSEDKRKK